MAGSFLSVAGRKTSDIREFLRDAVTGGNSLRYKPEAGKKHHIYIPYMTVEEVDGDGNKIIKKELVAMYSNVHDWMEGDTYKAVVCLKDVVRYSDDGKTMLNDGSCPFCNRVGDAWDIYRYRIEHEEKTCGKAGQELTKHMEAIKGKFADERKSKESRSYVYLLIVQFRLDATNNLIIGSDGLPEYDLRVVKWSASRAEKIQQVIENTQDEFLGTEIIFEYPNNDDPRQVVGQSTTTPVFPHARIITRFPAVKDKIQAEIAKFTWEGIEKAYPEWSGMTVAEAEKTVNALFQAWDNYKAELTVNPNAKYLEYVGTAGPAVSNPALSTTAGAVPTGIPTAVPGVAPQAAAGAIPGVAPQAPPVPGVPQGGPIPTAPQGAPVQMPGMMDPNQIFGDVNLGAPATGEGKIVI